MREAAIRGNDVAVFEGGGQVALEMRRMHGVTAGQQVLEMAHAVRLGVRVFGMHQRHGQEDPAHQGQGGVFSLCQRAGGQRASARVAGERPWQAAKHVAGELVEQDHQREPVQDRCFPVGQAARDGLLHGGPETLADFRIQRRTAGEPALPHRAGGPPEGQPVVEPEIQNPCGQDIRHGLQMLKLNARLESVGSRSSSTGVLARRMGARDWPA